MIHWWAIHIYKGNMPHCPLLLPMIFIKFCLPLQRVPNNWYKVDLRATIWIEFTCKFRRILVHGSIHQHYKNATTLAMTPFPTAKKIENKDSYSWFLSSLEKMQVVKQISCNLNGFSRLGREIETRWAMLQLFRIFHPSSVCITHFYFIFEHLIKW